MFPVKTTTGKRVRPARRAGKKVTLDDVWATINEIGQAHKETEAAMKEVQAAHAKTEATINEIGQAHKETEAAMKEVQAAMKEVQAAHAKTEATINEIGQAHKEVQAALKETQRIVGDLGNKFGDEAEHTLVPGLLDKFEQFGFSFRVISRNRKINDNEHDIHAEIDAFLENGTQTMAVEVKAKLQKADVDNHVRRMEKLHRHADLHGDKRKYFGAMAATVVSDRERDYALENGFYVIEPSGEDVKVTQPIPNPKVW